MNQDEWLGTLKYASGKAQDKVTVDSLMLRYRPIAPKPTTGTNSGDNNSYGIMSNKRTKRKYVRVSKNNNKNTCRGKTRSDDGEQAGVVTLQLMPEKSDLSGEHTRLDQDPTAKTTELETWVTVEAVTSVLDGSSSSSYLGCTDVEIVDSLGKDTWPAFVSDGSNRVVWVNEAYRRNVSGEDESSVDGDVVVVWLVVDESTEAMYCNYRGFTCRVKMQYTWRETKYTKTVPCDVWKMEFGGFAWRLDTTAALTLWL